MVHTDLGELTGRPLVPGDAQFVSLRSKLIGLAFSMTGSREDAEDAVQDVWLRWQRHRDSVEDALPWLRTVTRNVVIDRYRDRSNTSMATLDHVLAQQPAGQELVASMEAVQDVRPAFAIIVGALSGLERAVFVLHEGLEWPYPDVARILGRSETAVRQLGHRARRHLAATSPRFVVDSSAVDAIAWAYVRTSSGGDVLALMEALAPGVASRLPLFNHGDRRIVHDVAGIVLFRADRLVLCRRRRDQAWYPGVWDVPGAHRRHGEPAVACAVRAARDKIGIDITHPRPCGEHVQDDFRLSLFTGPDWHGQPQNRWPDQHDKIGLFTRDEAARLILADPRLLMLYDEVRNRMRETSL